MRCFISYASSDSSKVDMLCEALKRSRITYWRFDNFNQAGQPLNRALPLAVDNSTLLLLCLSLAAYESRHVERELTYALDRRPIVPIELEPNVWQAVPKDWEFALGGLIRSSVEAFLSSDIAVLLADATERFSMKANAICGRDHTKNRPIGLPTTHRLSLYFDRRTPEGCLEFSEWAEHVSLEHRYLAVRYATGNTVPLRFQYSKQLVETIKLVQSIYYSENELRSYIHRYLDDFQDAVAAIELNISNLDAPDVVAVFSSKEAKLYGILRDVVSHDFNAG